MLKLQGAFSKIFIALSLSLSMLGVTVLIPLVIHEVQADYVELESSTVSNLYSPLKDSGLSVETSSDGAVEYLSGKIKYEFVVRNNQSVSVTNVVLTNTITGPFDWSTLNVDWDAGGGATGSYFSTNPTGGDILILSIDVLTVSEVFTWIVELDPTQPSINGEEVINTLDVSPPATIDGSDEIKHKVYDLIVKSITNDGFPTHLGLNGPTPSYTYSYELVVANKGNITRNDSNVTFTLPPETELDRVLSSTGSELIENVDYTKNGQKITIDPFSFPPHTTSWIIEVRVQDTLSYDKQNLYSTASIEADNYKHNKNHETSDTEASVNLVIEEFSQSTGTVSRLEIITYSVKIINKVVSGDVIKGRRVAGNVTLNLSLPSEEQVDYLGADCGASKDPTITSFQLITINPSELNISKDDLFECLVTIKVVDTIPHDMEKIIARLALTYQESSFVTTPIPALDTTPDITVEASPDVSLGETAIPVETIPGASVQQSIIITNSGYQDLKGFTLTKYLSPTFILTTYPTDACNIVEQMMHCDYQNEIISAQDNFSMTVSGELTVTVLTGYTMNNKLVLSALYNPEDQANFPAPIQNETPVLVNKVADLVVSMTGTPNTSPGEWITYTVIITNEGFTTATNIRLDNTPPAHTVSSVAFSGTTQLTQIGSGWPLDDLMPNEKYTINLSYQVEDTTYPGPTSIINVITAETDIDPLPNSNSASANTIINIPASLTVTISRLSSPPNTGEPIVYSLKATNASQGPVTNLRLSTRIPDYTNINPNETKVPDEWNGAALADSTVITWDIASLAVEEEQSFNLVVIVKDSLDQPVVTLTNVATLKQGDSFTTTTDVVVVNAALDLEISATTNPTLPAAGDIVTYLITATNKGNLDPSTTATTIFGALPDFVTPDLASASCNTPSLISPRSSSLIPSDYVPIKTGFNLSAGYTITCTLQAQLDSELIAIYTYIPAIFTVTTEHAGETTSASTGIIRTEISGTPRITMTQTAIPPTAVKGNPVKFQVMITNEGSIEVRDILVTSTLKGADQVQWQNLGNYVEKVEEADMLTLTYKIDSLAAGQAVSPIEMVYTVTSETGQFTNTTFVGLQGDVVAEAIDEVVIGELPDLELNYSVVPEDVIGNQQIIKIYFMVTNDGYTTSQTSTLTTTIPPYTEFVMATEAMTIASDEGTWLLPPITVGETITRQLVIRAVGPLPANSDAETTQLQATVISDNDLRPDNNNSMITISLADFRPDLQVAIHLTDNGDGKIVSGEELTFTLIASNTGTQFSENVQVILEAIPPEYISLDANSFGCYVEESGISNRVIWLVGGVLSNSNITCDVDAKVVENINLEEDVFITVTASITDEATYGADSNPANNTTLPMVRQIVVSSNISVDLLASNPNIHLFEGDTITYTILLHNDGNLRDDDIQVELNVSEPNAGQEYVEFYKGECDGTPVGSESFIQDIAPQTTITCLLTYEVNRSLENLFEHQVKVLIKDKLGNPLDNDTVSHAVYHSSVVTLQADREATVAGELVEFTFTVTNPTGLPVTVTSKLALRMTEKSQPFTIPVWVDEVITATNSPWQQSVMITTPTESDIGDLLATLTITDQYGIAVSTTETVLVEPELNFSITPERENILPGDTITYTIALFSDQTIPNMPLEVRFIPSSQISLRNSSTTGNHGVIQANEITWTPLTVTARQTTTLLVQVTLDENTPSTENQLQATLTANGEPAQNTIRIFHLPEISIWPHTPVANFGNIITYTIHITNPNQAQVDFTANLTAFGRVGSRLEPLTVSVPSTQLSLKAAIPPGRYVDVGEYSSVLTVPLLPDLKEINAQVTVEDTEQIGTQAASTTVRVYPRVAVTKTDNLLKVVPQEPITYRIILISDQDITGVNLTDTLPISLTDVRPSSNGVLSENVGDNGIINWSNLSLTANEPKYLTVTAKVVDDVPQPMFRMTNQVLVYAEAMDDSVEVADITDIVNPIRVDVVGPKAFQPYDGVKFYYVIRNIGDNVLQNLGLEPISTFNAQLQLVRPENEPQLIPETFAPEGVLIYRSIYTIPPDIESNYLMTALTFTAEQTDGLKVAGYGSNVLSGSNSIHLKVITSPDGTEVDPDPPITNTGDVELPTIEFKPNFTIRSQRTTTGHNIIFTPQFNPPDNGDGSVLKNLTIIAPISAAVKGGEIFTSGEILTHFISFDDISGGETQVVVTATDRNGDILTRTTKIKKIYKVYLPLIHKSDGPTPISPPEFSVEQFAPSEIPVGITTTITFPLVRTDENNITLDGDYSGTYQFDNGFAGEATGEFLCTRDQADNGLCTLNLLVHPTAPNPLMITLTLQATYTANSKQFTTHWTTASSLKLTYNPKLEAYIEADSMQNADNVTYKVILVHASDSDRSPITITSITGLNGQFLSLNPDGGDILTWDFDSKRSNELVYDNRGGEPVPPTNANTLSLPINISGVDADGDPVSITIEKDIHACSVLAVDDFSYMTGWIADDFREVSYLYNNGKYKMNFPLDQNTTLDPEPGITYPAAPFNLFEVYALRVDVNLEGNVDFWGLTFGGEQAEDNEDNQRFESVNRLYRLLVVDTTNPPKLRLQYIDDDTHVTNWSTVQEVDINLSETTESHSLQAECNTGFIARLNGKEVMNIKEDDLPIQCNGLVGLTAEGGTTYFDNFKVCGIQ